MKLSASGVMYGRDKRVALTPWHKRATANAKRLRARAEQQKVEPDTLPANGMSDRDRQRRVDLTAVKHQVLLANFQQPLSHLT
jgi:hypothetical protein